MFHTSQRSFLLETQGAVSTEIGIITDTNFRFVKEAATLPSRSGKVGVPLDHVRVEYTFFLHVVKVLLESAPQGRRRLQSFFPKSGAVFQSLYPPFSFGAGPAALSAFGAGHSASPLSAFRHLGYGAGHSAAP